jgi:SAM-dependent methyltransferase
MFEKIKCTLRNPYYYLRFRAQAELARFKDWRNEIVYSGPSTPCSPPPLLRHRVHGDLDKEGYIKVGQVAAQNIKDLLNLVGRQFNSFNSILDFGCGSGRVLRFLYNENDPCHLYGTDIDKKAISWCKKHLRFAQWDTNGSLPPTRYADDTFDLIYGISVFTHLDEEMQFIWLNELNRILKPDGVLILTLHGDGLAFQGMEEEQALLSRKGFIFKVRQTGRFKFDGLPDFYQYSHHSKQYIEKEWSRFFEVIRYEERALNSHQDAVILCKSPSEVIVKLESSENIDPQSIDVVRVRAAGQSS